MAQKSRWRGTKQLEQGKVHWRHVADKDTATTTFGGPYSKCLTGKPKIGQSISGIRSDLKVVQVEVAELDGEAGRIDVTLEVSVEEQSNNFAPLGAPIFEIEYVELQKPLETHPRCGTLAPKSTKTWEDWESLEEADGEEGGDYQPVSSSGEPAWSLEEYQSLKKDGQDSYTVHYPVVRVTTQHLAKPNGIGSGTDKLQNPPSNAGFGAVNRYQWKGGVDRCTKQGRSYSRCREWIGAEYWSRLTYDDG